MGIAARNINHYFLILSLCFASACAGDVIVSNGSFQTIVDPPGNLPILNNLDLGPLSPFVESQSSVYQLSFSNAQHDLSWSGNDVIYRLDTQHHLQGFEGFVRSSGSMRIESSIDSMLTIHQEYAYDHPPGLIGSTGIVARVRLASTNTTVFVDGDGGGTFDLGPPAGTLLLDAAVPLTANTAYVFSFVMDSHSFDPILPAAVWAGTGFMSVEVHPVPEPAALFPLALIAMLRRERRNRQLR